MDSSLAITRRSDRSGSLSLRNRWRSFHRRNRNDAVRCIAVRELPSNMDAPRSASVSFCTAHPLAVTASVNCDGHHPSASSSSPRSARGCGGSGNMDENLMEQDEEVSNLRLSARSRVTCVRASGKGEGAEQGKENTTGAGGGTGGDLPRPRSRSVAGYCSSIAKTLVGAVDRAGRVRSRLASEALRSTRRLSVDSREGASSDSAVSLSPEEISSPSSDSSSSSPSSGSERPSPAARASSTASGEEKRLSRLPSCDSNLCVDHSKLLSVSSSCTSPASSSSSSSSCWTGDSTTRVLPTPPLPAKSASVLSPSVPDSHDRSSMLMMATHHAGLAERPLPLLPAPSASGIPISSAVQSAVAHEVSRTMTLSRHMAAMRVPKPPSPSTDDGYWEGRGGDQPPPLPARGRACTVTAGMLPARRSATMPLPPTPPTPPPRHLPENGVACRTGNVYDDPEALERAFGPLRDVGRWYRTVAARQLAMHVAHSVPPPLPVDGVAMSRSARSASMALPQRPQVEYNAPAAPAIPPKVSPDAGEDTEHSGIYERRPADHAHTSLLEGLEDLAKHGWYWGPVSRDESAEILADKPDGTFLVRDSTDDRYLLSLTFRVLGRTLHTRIQHFHGSFSFYERPTSASRCRTVVALIEMAMEQSIDGPFCHSSHVSRSNQGVPVRLLYPHSRFRTMRSLQQQCRFVIRQATRCDLICELPLPKIMKSFLMESPFHIG